MNAPTIPLERRRRPGARIYLIVSQALQVLALLPWFVVAMLSLMATDTADAAEPATPWAFALAVWSFPLWVIGFGIAAWRAYRRAKVRRAIVLTTIPLIPALVLLYYVVWLTSSPA